MTLDLMPNTTEMPVSSELVRLLCEHLESHPRSIVLELACGAGAVAGALAPRCLHWFGVDHDGRTLVAAARRLQSHSNVTLVEQPTEDLTRFYDGIFDLVCINHRAAPTDPNEQVTRLREIQRLLRLRGFCAVASTDESWHKAFVGLGFDVIEQPRATTAGGITLARQRQRS